MKPVMPIQDVAVLSAAMERIAQHFVVRAYRERVVVDLVRKPERLIGRIAHRGDTVFDPRCKHATVEVGASSMCAVLGPGSAVAFDTWATMHGETCGGGGALLFLALDGSWFHAEAEGFPPPATWFGSLRA